jgi:hypothetical protein
MCFKDIKQKNGFIWLRIGTSGAEHINEFLDWLRNYWLLKKNLNQWIWFFEISLTSQILVCNYWN